MGRKKAKNQFVFKIFAVFILLLIGVYNMFVEIEVEKNLTEELSQDVAVLFCTQTNCFSAFEKVLNEAQEEIKCAIYEIDYEPFSQLLLDKANNNVSVSVIVENDYKDEEGVLILKNSSVEFYTDGKATKFMHNKYCVVDDEVVITGSMNPTENGFNYNDNNVLVFRSEKLAVNYEREFNQLITGVYSSQKISTLEYQDIILKHGDEEYVVSNYFCPQDECRKATLELLEKAESEILFMNFVLTQDDVEELLVQKSIEGVDVKGVIESRMFRASGSRASEINSSFSLIKDSNPKTMHHKVFIVDERYVLTGSMNPTNAGTAYNDENILIIDSKKIAKLFKEEFERVSS